MKNSMYRPSKSLFWKQFLFVVLVILALTGLTALIIFVATHI